MGQKLKRSRIVLEQPNTALAKIDRRELHLAGGCALEYPSAQCNKKAADVKAAKAKASADAKAAKTEKAKAAADAKAEKAKSAADTKK
jgi:hypothetical protein